MSNSTQVSLSICLLFIICYNRYRDIDRYNRVSFYFIKSVSLFVLGPRFDDIKIYESLQKKTETNITMGGGVKPY